MVTDQIQVLLDFLDPFQSGFWPGFGTETALVALYDYLCWERDRANVFLLTLLDLSVAFNAINHCILLERLSELSFCGTALQWFQSFLDGCLQWLMLGELFFGKMWFSMWGPLGFNSIPRVV